MDGLFLHCFANSPLDKQDFPPTNPMPLLRTVVAFQILRQAMQFSPFNKPFKEDIDVMISVFILQAAC